MKKQIEETKVPKTKKCGVLPFVSKFEVSAGWILRLLVTNLTFIPAEITGYGLDVYMQFENMPMETSVVTSNKVLQLHEGLELNYALLQR